MRTGKKNFLPPCQLTMGFGMMFKVCSFQAVNWFTFINQQLDEGSLGHHLNERRVKITEEDQQSLVST